MALCIRNRETEHAGAKHGGGAFYGRKALAKYASNKERRRNGQQAVTTALEDDAVERLGLSSDGRRGRRSST